MPTYTMFITPGNEFLEYVPLRTLSAQATALFGCATFIVETGPGLRPMPICGHKSSGKLFSDAELRQLAGATFPS